MKCCSDCHQGRKPCPTPEACELPQADDSLLHIAAVLIVIAVCYIALLYL